MFTTTITMSISISISISIREMGSSFFVLPSSVWVIYYFFYFSSMSLAGEIVPSVQGTPVVTSRDIVPLHAHVHAR